MGFAHVRDVKPMGHTVDATLLPDLSDLETFTIEDIAKLFKKSVASIYTDLNRKPNTLPPSFVLPGTRRRLWLKPVVIKWLTERGAFNLAPQIPTDSHQVASKKRRGAPTKAERREKRLTQSAATAGH